MAVRGAPMRFLPRALSTLNPPLLRTHQGGVQVKDAATAVMNGLTSEDYKACFLSYSEVPVHDHHVYYAYEPSAPSHGSVATSKHNYGGHKSGASMSALTLLAFLFFLHILQQCIKDHMTDMSTAPVMIMTAGREGDDSITKSATFNKIDKTGMTESNFEVTPDNDRMDANKQNKITEKYGEKNPYDIDDSSNKHQLMKIKTAHVTKSDETKRKYVLKNYANRSNSFAGFYSAMDEE